MAFKVGDKVRCIEPDDSLPVGYYTIEKVRDDYVDVVDSTGKMHPSWYARRFQIIEEEKKEFKKGEYIVITRVHTDANYPTNYCFKQRETLQHLRTELDCVGSTTNGWPLINFEKVKNYRYATSEEAAEYERIGKPYDVTTLQKKTIGIQTGGYYISDKYLVKITSSKASGNPTTIHLGHYIANEISFNTVGGFYEKNLVPLVNKDDIAWIEACVKANKFVSKAEAIKKPLKEEPMPESYPIFKPGDKVRCVDIPEKYQHLSNQSDNFGRGGGWTKGHVFTVDLRSNNIVWPVCGSGVYAIALELVTEQVNEEKPMSKFRIGDKVIHRGQTTVIVAKADTEHSNKLNYAWIIECKGGWSESPHYTTAILGDKSYLAVEEHEISLAPSDTPVVTDKVEYKVGDVVILPSVRPANTKNTYWATGNMDKFLGKEVVITTANRNHFLSNDAGVWSWDYEWLNNQIPKNRTTTSYEVSEYAVLYEEAKWRYPIGCVVDSLVSSYKARTISSHENRIYLPNVTWDQQIWFCSSDGFNILVYSNGKWASLSSINQGLVADIKYLPKTKEQWVKIGEVRPTKPIITAFDAPVPLRQVVLPKVQRREVLKSFN